MATPKHNNEGLPLEYVEIVGQPNDIVLAEIARSAFVIDQLYSDTPMAGFAAEAARLGKPAIVCRLPIIGKNAQPMQPLFTK